MSQQTTLKAVLPYYERWMNRFPDFESLAGSHLEDALKLWAGLGYYRRARFLHGAAQWVCDHGLPKNSIEWKQVPGVGEYTAAAVSSICFDEPIAVVDGNVDRVFSRVTCCDAKRSRRMTACKSWANEILNRLDPGQWNQAVMELGAMICKPKNPECRICPISNACQAFQTNVVSMFPFVEPRTPTKRLKIRLAMAFQDEKLAVVQFGSDSWWEKMWGFPNLRQPSFANDHLLGTFEHTITNHKITFEVYNVSKVDGKTQWMTIDQVRLLPLPVPHKMAFELFLKFNLEPAVLNGLHNKKHDKSQS